MNPSAFLAYPLIDGKNVYAISLHPLKSQAHQKIFVEIKLSFLRKKKNFGGSKIIVFEKKFLWG